MKKLFFSFLICVSLIFFCSPVSAAEPVPYSSLTEIFGCTLLAGTDNEYVMLGGYLPIDDIDILTIYIEEKNTFYFTSSAEGSSYFATFKQNMKDYSTGNVQNIIFHDKLDSISLPYPVYYFAYNIDLHAENVQPAWHFADITYETVDEFIAALEECLTYEDFMISNNPVSNGHLPLLTFQINQALTMGESLTDEASVKYTFDWSVSQHDIYANNPNKYQIQMIASADISATSVMGTDVLITNEIQYMNDACKCYVSSGIPIYKETYSFLERTYRGNLCDIAGVDKYDWGANNFYYLYIRVVEPGTENVSLWKVYRCQGRSITPTGIIYDDSGSGFTYEDDSVIDDTFEYDDDPRTDDFEDPNSPFYNDGTELDAKFLLNNLENIISMLKNIPDLFTKVFGWMPQELIVLITVSIGLLFIVGFVKMFLR